jgi:hypothetical protein
MKEFTSSGMTLTKKTVVIIRFGPETAVSGMTPAQYYQVTVDPEMTSPSGDYIRFGEHQGDEIRGWQKTSAMHIIEVLGEWEGDQPPKMTIGNSSVTMLATE